MDPASLALVSAGATMGGKLIDAFGSVLSGNAHASMYKYQAGVAQVNRTISLQNADYARFSGEVRAQESGMQTRARIGQTAAIQGGSGLDVNSGSAALVRDSESDIGRFDQAMIRSNAAKEAYGYDVEAMRYGTQSSMYGAAAKGAKTAGWIGAASSILGGAGSVASKWYQASGTFGTTPATASTPTPDPTLQLELPRSASDLY